MSVLNLLDAMTSFSFQVIWHLVLEEAKRQTQIKLLLVLPFAFASVQEYLDHGQRYKSERTFRVAKEPTVIHIILANDATKKARASGASTHAPW